MEIKEQGQILELDPKKEYWLFVKAGSILGSAAKRGLIKRRKGGTILTFGDMDEFKFVENSDRIKGIVLEEG